MFQWLQHRIEKGIRRRAENMVMQNYDVSRAYVQEVIANSEAYARGEISSDEWICRAVHIALKYPADSRLNKK